MQCEEMEFKVLHHHAGTLTAVLKKKEKEYTVSFGYWDSPNNCMVAKGVMTEMQ